MNIASAKGPQHKPLWIFCFRKNFQQFIIGQKEETWKVKSLLFQVFIQSLRKRCFIYFSLIRPNKQTCRVYYQCLNIQTFKMSSSSSFDFFKRSSIFSMATTVRTCRSYDKAAVWHNHVITNKGHGIVCII